VRERPLDCGQCLVRRDWRNVFEYGPAKLIEITDVAKQAARCQPVFRYAKSLGTGLEITEPPAE